MLLPCALRLCRNVSMSRTNAQADLLQSTRLLHLTVLTKKASSRRSQSLISLSDPQVFSGSQVAPSLDNGDNLFTFLIRLPYPTAPVAGIPFSKTVTPRRKRLDQPGVCLVQLGYPNPAFAPFLSPPFVCFIFLTPLLHLAL